MQTNTSTRIFYFFQEANLYWRVCVCVRKPEGKGKGEGEKKERKRKKRRNYIEDKIWT